jgi:hypothetical protein
LWCKELRSGGLRIERSLEGSDFWDFPVSGIGDRANELGGDECNPDEVDGETGPKTGS